LKTTATYHSYQKTYSITELVLDYLNGADDLQSHVNYKNDFEGVLHAIEERKKFEINRSLLVSVFESQYQNISTTKKVRANIASLSDVNTFTICTAHQPNIFTGYLYFIYKILHVIKIADELNANSNNTHFVPVYFMGSEDADLNELGEIYIEGKTYKWETNQQGAVGRMKVDESLLNLLDEISRQITVDPFGKDLITLLRDAYTLGESIAQATFKLVNQLFGEYGLLVLLPDNRDLKNACKQLMRSEVVQHHSYHLINEFTEKFPKKYKIQATGRPINLFYIKDDFRERIEASADGYIVLNTNLGFSKQALMDEIENHPERFSPNVILRPLYQELILPNVAFIGGGGEVAYWIELKPIFDFYQIHYPTLILRNSFVIIEESISMLIKKMKIAAPDYFLPITAIQEKYLSEILNCRLVLNEEKEILISGYDAIRKMTDKIDQTLSIHTNALEKAALKKVEALEKKIVRAEKKRKYEALLQLEKIKNAFYPKGILQERKDNFMPYYSKYGDAFISELYQASQTFNQTFCLLEISK